ncbi:hypothetical protein Tco_1491375 [Tanacetum coccineum]
MCVVNILSSMNATPIVKIVLNKGKQIWKLKGKLSDNSLNKTKQIWQPKGKLSDNSLNKTKQVWKATGKLFANVGYQWRPTGNKFTSGKLNCGYQWRPTGKKFALGELCPLTRFPVTCGTDHPLVSGLRLFKTRFRGMDGSCTHQFRTRAYNDVWTKQFKPRSSSNDVCSNQFKPRFSNVTKASAGISSGPMLKGETSLGIYRVAKEDPIFRISVDMCQNTNYFRAFTTSANTKKHPFESPPARWLFVNLLHRTYRKKLPVVEVKGKGSSTELALKDPEPLNFDEYQGLVQLKQNGEPVPMATVVNALIVSTNTSVSTSIAQDAPSTSHSLSSLQVHPPVFPQGEPSSAQSTSGDVSLAEPNQVNQPPDHLRRWTKDHPLDNIVGNPSRPVSTRKQLASDALWCCFHTELSKVEPKNFKMAVIEDCWFQAMQDEIQEK